MNRPIFKFAFYLSLLIGIGLVGLWIAHGKHGSSGQAASMPARSGVADAEHKALYWYDPMYPNQHFDHPGKSPFMDMQLVAKMPDEETSGGTPASGSVTIDPRVVQNLGVRLAPVERGQFARVVDTVGLVAVDEHRIQAVQDAHPAGSNNSPCAPSATRCGAASCWPRSIRRICWRRSRNS